MPGPLATYRAPNLVPVKPETRFYKRVNSRLPRDIHYQKITSLYGSGTPDFWYSGNKADAWIEYKWLPRLPLNGVVPQKLLTALQLNWINRRHQEGRRVLVIIGSPEGCVILENGTWNAVVPNDEFRLTESDLSALLTGLLHDPSAVLRKSGACHQSNI